MNNVDTCILYEEADSMQNQQQRGKLYALSELRKSILCDDFIDAAIYLRKTAIQDITDELSCVHKATILHLR
jgi:hypothetical protein